MAKKKYKVVLTQKQRQQLKALSQRGKVSARKLNRARILLLADENRPKGPMTDSQIQSVLDVGFTTIPRIRQRFAACGLPAALEEKPRPGRPVEFCGKQRAVVTALACSTPPDGHDKWSLRLLAKRLVELEMVETISYKTVSNILKKTNFHPT